MSDFLSRADHGRQILCFVDQFPYELIGFRSGGIRNGEVPNGEGNRVARLAYIWIGLRLGDKLVWWRELRISIAFTYRWLGKHRHARLPASTSPAPALLVCLLADGQHLKTQHTEQR